MNHKEFETYWVTKLNNETKHFPESFIKNIETKNMKMPGTDLLKGSYLFGKYEISDTNGNTFLQTENIFKLKYILYSNRNKPLKIKIPKKKNEIEQVVKNYEKYLDEVLKNMEQECKKKFGRSFKHKKLINKIFSLANLHRY